MRYFGLFNSIIFSIALMCIAFAVMTSLQIHVGSFGDWVFGLLSMLWLFAIVTIPWNIYFKAKQVLADAQPTRERGLPVDERQVTYVRNLEKYSLWAAIGLHVFSAITLFVLAAVHVNQIGYVASVLALLLTGLRPAASAYEYLAERLRSIGETWRYPREDVVELRGRVNSMESSLKQIQTEFDVERPESLVSKQRTSADDSRREIARVQADVESLRATNENEHERLSEEARSAVSQLSTDGQFLDHVREILRFFKSA